ncbi:hypothetical protein ACWCWD_22665 [Streptomyces sp. NPDC001493]
MSSSSTPSTGSAPAIAPLTRRLDHSVPDDFAPAPSVAVGTLTRRLDHSVPDDFAPAVAQS